MKVRREDDERGWEMEFVHWQPMQVYRQIAEKLRCLHLEYFG